MIAAFQRRPLAVSLAAVAVVLAVIIAIELGVGGGLRSALAPSAAKRTAFAEAKLLPPVTPLAPEQAYPETTARPLFLPTRRPAPEAPPTDKKTLVPGQFVLQGVTIAGATRIALLREKANGRIHRVERGREVNGIQVIEIQPEVVTLAQGGEREVLSLQVQKPTGTPAAPAQAGPFGTTPAVPPTQPTSPTGMPVPAGAPPLPTAQQPQAAPVPPRTGMFPAQPTPVPPGTAPANPVTRELAAPLTPEELLARRRARRNQQTQ
jgi:general secretion pathway protein N